MHLSQTKDNRVIFRCDSVACVVNGVGTTYELALMAIRSGRKLQDVAMSLGLGQQVNLAKLLEEDQLDCPIRHPDPAHLIVSGTGLTHLGSAATRNSMHAQTNVPADSSTKSDSMKMFQMGLEGGTPKDGEKGVQPEWFYKGSGRILAAPVRCLTSPSFGPEILIGDLPRDIRGTSRICREGKVVWEKPFLSGEDNMSHSVRNLEDHHFKYDDFRTPGDINVHMLGTATLSFGDGFSAREGDSFEISSPEHFGLVRKNPLAIAKPRNIEVKTL